ncbi:cadherin EGF LAG seven-pass G-type receptor 1 [Nephila pilipes]|uniref:Cadherin EGF LAG seven-pass G-type receptor 1 n=1 Tax=Nephila pilipes TaxID=299642 RepID=A0A8X6T4A1_NEPPI|nr:cadherin EGF LAG seven-pass G-type receptor 1 [Nephila pilipes]
MHVFVCLISFMLTIHLSSLRATNSSETTESTTEALLFQTLAPNTSLKLNSEPSYEQQTLPLNATTAEATSWTTNSLDLAPNESLVSSPTTSSITEAQPITEVQSDILTGVATAGEPTTSTAPVTTSTTTTTTTTTTTQQSSSTKLAATESIGKETNTMNTVLSSTEKIQLVLSTSRPLHPVVSENITSYEEPMEHNAILIPDSESTTDKGMNIIVGHKCTRIFQDSTLWNDTDGGMLALKSCPYGYQGNMYRPCFSNGKWGSVDYSECRLEHLGRMRHMIVHQVQKGMLGNMYVLAEEFSKYISSVDMKSPMDRLEAFEILNIFLKLDMNPKMDKTRDTKYIQTILHACNELIKKKTVLFPPGSQENKLITEKAVEMVFHLTYFAERALRGLLKTQKKQMAFRSSPNVALYLYRGKLSGPYPIVNFTTDHVREDDFSSFFNLEKTLERSSYALVWIKGLRGLLSTTELLVNSDIAVATILSPLNSLNHMANPPTFDIGLRMEKGKLDGYTLECGQLWNMTQLWNTKDCIKASVKGDIVTCRCHHLGSIAVLLQEESHGSSLTPVPPIGKLISASCIISLTVTILTLIVNFFLKRGEQHLSIFIFINMIVCMVAIQVLLLYGVNKEEQTELCLSSAMLLHYLFLVLCCWVVAYSVNLLKRLKSNMEYIGRPRDYCGVCWVWPGIMLIIAFTLNPNVYETTLYCWMNIRRGIFWSFVIPVTGLILINTIVMILSLKTFNEQMSVTHRTEICKTRNSLRAGITLLPFFAMNWFFGILAVEDSYNIGLQVMFFFTNAMQGILTFVFFCLMDTNIQASFRMKVAEVSRKPKVSAMKLTKSGSFPILERSLITLTDDRRRLDCTPLLASRMAYHDVAEDPCCSNIRV